MAFGGPGVEHLQRVALVATQIADLGQDEVLVLLDRVELFEPYHLKDFSSSLSIIPPRALREVNLITGGFPAQYGDRMSGVLDMKTALPDRRRTLLGLGLLNAEVGTSGDFAGQRGHWLGSVRRGSLDLALDLIGQELQPQYWDAFGKIDYPLGDSHRLSLHALHSDDRLNALVLEPDAEEDYRTSYGNSYFWLGHQGILGSKKYVDSTFSFGLVDRDRTGAETEEGEGGFFIQDRRSLEVFGIKQEWGYESGPDHFLGWGFDARRLRAEYDYFNLRELEEDPLGDLRSQPRTGTTRFLRDFEGDQFGAYVSDRFRPRHDLTLELGVRFDRQTLTEDSDLSPRFNLVWSPGARTTLRLAWGFFHQSQRPYELAVEDGETELAPSERTEQRVLGFESTFSVGENRSDVLLRVEAYQRDVTNPRVRYENIFEPISEFPEIEPDRFRVAPERSRAYGIEFFLRGTWGPKVDWWASYAWSRTEDRIDGREVPRRFDQPHAFNFDINYELGDWNLNLAWRYHSGWPTTAVSGRLEIDDEGELEAVPVFGPVNGARLPDYHRLDLRASREWTRRHGVLGFFLEIQNVYDRQNVAGFDVDFEFTESQDGPPALIPLEEVWGGILPSFGITWEF